jgi:membrane-associated protease RseP (regulator of RpoE activity)
VLGGISMVLFVHELGHYCGLRVRGLAVESVTTGVGPLLAGARVDDTRFELRLFPLLGYTVSKVDSLEGESATRFARWLKRLSFGDLAVALAGPAANLVLGALLICLGRRAPLTWRLRRRTRTWVQPQWGQPFYLGDGRRLCGFICVVVDGTRVLRRGPRDFLLFGAAISLSIGIANLIPLPPFDGGRILLFGCSLLPNQELARNVAVASFLVGTFASVVTILFLGFLDIQALLRRRRNKIKTSDSPPTYDRGWEAAAASALRLERLPAISLERKESL